MSKIKIPCFIIEEHNEALPIWINSINKGLINRNGNVLLHFDDHSDMTALKFNESINDIFSWDAHKVYDFTMKNTSIASFIIAACYLKIFDEVNWIQYDGVKNSKNAYVTTYNDDGKNIITGAFYEDNPLMKFNHHTFKYNTFSSFDFLNSSEFISSEFLLDIDLDYFSCEIDPENINEVIIEITEDEFNSFNDNIYHGIRFLVNRVETMISDDKYYLVINYYKDITPSPRKNTKNEIDKRIEQFTENIISLKKWPKLITICRSRYSGYTPHDQWQYIENKIIKCLEKQFSIKINYVNGK